MAWSLVCNRSPPLNQHWLLVIFRLRSIANNLGGGILNSQKISAVTHFFMIIFFAKLKSFETLISVQPLRGTLFLLAS